MGAVFAERCNRTIRDLPKRLAFGKGDSNLIDMLPTLTKQSIDRLHTSAKSPPIKPFLKKNEGYVYKQLLDKRNKTKPKFRVNYFVRFDDVKKTFSKGETTNWNYKLYKVTENFNDTISSYHIDNLPERYRYYEALLKKRELSMKANDSVMKKNKLKLNQNVVDHPSLC